MRGPRHGNGRPHLIGKKNTDPLRKIVATTWDEYERRIEVLECGHSQPQRQDIIGPTNAYRRRCRKCRDLCCATFDNGGKHLLFCALPAGHAKHLHETANGTTWSRIVVGATERTKA